MTDGPDEGRQSINRAGQQASRPPLRRRRHEPHVADDPEAHTPSLEPGEGVGDPVDDVGEGVVFLCGPQSRYVTGTTLMLDGGRAYLR